MSGAEPPSVSARGLLEVPASGHTVLGRYTVLGQLGLGGMGVVLSAYDSRLDRRVALKLLHPRETAAGSPLDEQGRFLREAQSMARLNHPHVVAVYDAGTMENGTLFIAMEHVEGQTLRSWRAPQRTWREVLAMYLAAGHGLAAAHAAGLVHRDFKPDNVLVGRDERVRVTDFGLARLDSSAAPTEPVSVPALGSSSVDPRENLTPHGPWMGTPRYMAPEVLKGQRADARSDLYSFCASLYEALYGTSPFPGDTIVELLRAQEAGKLAPPVGSGVPDWVGRTVLQGLKADPSRRPKSMEAVLAALEDDPEVKRRARLRASGVGLLMLSLAGLAAWGWGHQHDRGCGQVGQRLSGVWDAAVREKVQQATLSTGLSYARDTAERVTAALDAYAADWVKQSTQLCEGVGLPGSTQVRGLGALRESCLKQRRSQLQALTELLSRAPDPELVGRAVQAVKALPPLEDCEDAKALTAAVPLPEAPAARARIEALRAQVDRLEVLLEAGKYKEGLAVADTLLPQVESLSYAPLQARALLVTARLQDEVGAYAAAEARLRKAFTVAAQGKALDIMARTWGLLIREVGYRQDRGEEALAMQPASEALAAAADDDRLMAASLNSLGSVFYSLGRYEEARQVHTRVLALREKALGPDHPDVATSLTNLGGVLYNLGRYEEARAMNERAVALREKALGPEHPAVAGSLNNLGLALWKQGSLEESRQANERALAIREKALGPDHPDVAASLNNLGLVFLEMERHEEALKIYQRVLALWEKSLGPEHVDVALALDNQGLCLLRMKRSEEALPLFERAVALRQKLQGPDHPEMGHTLGNLADCLRQLGRYKEAREKYLRAMTVDEKALGPESPELAGPLLGLGLIALEQHRPHEALAPLERALRLAPEMTLAEVQFSLAQALWETNQDRPRARELAQQSLETLRRHALKSLLPEVTQWLEAHPSP
ncbi:serine/threonine-protein kinase [Hyalangium versicolor]|uniref:serine/threonine-protein kinase n=1 Tax=Hyalangium versicolor TaxID=2861190 RepID=UPI001CC98778|nr:serine/threonine-protein kinase [Hyalangium versicolor]